MGIGRPHIAEAQKALAGLAVRRIDEDRKCVLERLRENWPQQGLQNAMRFAALWIVLPETILKGLYSQARFLTRKETLKPPALKWIVWEPIAQQGLQLILNLHERCPMRLDGLRRGIAIAALYVDRPIVRSSDQDWP